MNECFISLHSLFLQCHIKISAAYGSMKDMSVYSALGLDASHIHIVGRPSKKHQHQCQVYLIKRTPSLSFPSALL